MTNIATDISASLEQPYNNNEDYEDDYDEDFDPNIGNWHINQYWYHSDSEPDEDYDATNEHNSNAKYNIGFDNLMNYMKDNNKCFCVFCCDDEQLDYWNRRHNTIRHLIDEIDSIKRVSDEICVISEVRMFGKVGYNVNPYPRLTSFIGGNIASQNFYTIGIQFQNERKGDIQIQRSFCKSCGNYRRHNKDEKQYSKVECQCYGDDDDEKDTLCVFQYLHDDMLEQHEGERESEEGFESEEEEEEEKTPITLAHEAYYRPQKPDYTWSEEGHHMSTGMNCGQSCSCCRARAGADLGFCLICYQYNKTPS